MLNLRVFMSLILAMAVSPHGYGASDALPARSFISGVPYTRQLTDYCGPASLSSLLAFWNVHISQKEIGRSVFAGTGLGTSAGDLLLYTREHGLAAYSMNSSLAELKRFISRGYPVLVLQDVSRTDSTGHFRVAVGYNDQTRTITFRDSMEPGLIRLSYNEFSKLWGKRDYWAMLAAQPKRDIFQGTLGRENTVLHLDLAGAYLHKRDYGGAERESRKALDIEPANPYARDLLEQSRKHSPVQL